MKDMLVVLKRAKEKRIFHYDDEFKELLVQIKAADSNLKLDWDDGAGEEWARFTNLADGIVCMINTKIGVVFIRESYEYDNIRSVVTSLEVVFTTDFCSNNWCIELDRLQNEVEEICWHTAPDVVDTTCFSLDDLYFATV